MGVQLPSYQQGQESTPPRPQATKAQNRARKKMMLRSKANQGNRSLYHWRTYSPNDSWLTFLRWFVGGGAANEQTSTELMDSFEGLAECIRLLREYHARYGMPDKGGPKDQDHVLREVVRDLYSGGTPIWALSNVMQKVSEGLTGDERANWLVLPRKAFSFSPRSGATLMFKIDRGFDLSKLDDMESVAVQLASYASNTSGVSNVPTHFPLPETLNKLAEEQEGRLQEELDENDVAEEILALASESAGLFFFVNLREYIKSTKDETVHDFWNISDTEQELFTRLACQEAMRGIDKIDANKKVLYPKWLIICFRILASAGACAFWFSGSWQDMIVAGVLAVVVAFIGESTILSRQEKLIFETIASFVVGLTSGLIAITWPNDTCFGAMAIAGVLDILQGFRVMYSVIEGMSRHTVAGAADLLEGILFTGLIAYFLRFGQYTAASILKDDIAAAEFEPCTNGINDAFYFLLVPLAALSWSGLFNPHYKDLIPMCLHGVLAYGTNYGLSQAGASDNVNNFASAAIVALSAGIVSRFTGRQAVGNTVAGLYVLLPGAYLVKSLYSTEVNGDFFFDIITRAVVIGIGAWTGSLLCSPTLLGTTRGLLLQQQSEHGGRNSRSNQHTMLMF